MTTDPRIHTVEPAPGPDGTAEMAALGITCVPVDVFHYKGFRYNNLSDALAEARRDRA